MNTTTKHFKFLKMAKCKNCGDKFVPRFNTMERYCWKPDCKTIEALQRLEKFKDQKAKEVKKFDREFIREKKLKLKTHSDWLQELQKVVNTYIRKRDEKKQCISCKNFLSGKFDAGHFYSVGSYPNLRFNEDNIHGQCVRCNRDLHGNLTEYRPRLIERIGEERMQALDEIRHEVFKPSIPEIIFQIADYKARVKKM